MSLVSAWTSLGIISALVVVQVPFDIRYRRLSRRATLLALIGAGVVVILESSYNQTFSSLILACVVTLLVASVYGLLHIVSAQALGFGDVLLVIPLSMLLAYQGLAPVVVWQVVATSSAMTHALIVRWRYGVKSIPFGPHLLISAWLVLVFSV